MRERERCIQMGNWKQERRDRKRQEERESSTGIRTVRLQELIREELNLLLRTVVQDPRLADVEITLVELTGDGSCARAWYTSEIDSDDELEGAAGFLRSELAEAMALKRTPELRFRRDPATRTFAAQERSK